MIKLVRLDYRLLHGQVVFAWTGHTGAQRIIVVDDDAATDELKKSALTVSKPAGVRLNIFTLEKTLAKMPKVRQLDENIMMIFGNVATLKAFCDANPDITEINYGGLANRAGAKQYGQAIFMTDAEDAETKEQHTRGVKIYMQQTPSDKKEMLSV